MFELYGIDAKRTIRVGVRPPCERWTFPDYSPGFSRSSEWIAGDAVGMRNGAEHTMRRRVHPSWKCQIIPGDTPGDLGPGSNPYRSDETKRAWATDNEILKTHTGWP